MGYVLLASALLAVGVFFTLREREIASLRARVHRIEQRQTAIEQENAALRARLARRDDLDLIEYLARRELGLIMPGEEKYILVEREP